MIEPFCAACLACELRGWADPWAGVREAETTVRGTAPTESNDSANLRQEPVRQLVGAGAEVWAP